MARPAGDRAPPAPLLAASAVPPWPARDGYSLRAGRLIEELARRWRVMTVSPGSDRGSPPDGVEWRRIQGLPATNMLPWHDAREHLTRTVESLVSGRDYRGAVLWSGTEYLAGEVDALPPAVGERIDCETLQAWRNRRQRSNLRQKIRFMRRGLQMAFYEGRVLRPLAGITATGEDDAAALERMTGHSRVEVVSNGVDLPRLDDLPQEGETPTVIFTGVLSYPPNAEAARWFAEEVWSDIRRRVPEARFVIAGRSPGRAVNCLERIPGVEVHADVPDLIHEIRRAWLAVAPMRSGTGVKNKVLEAWAAERPVVLTELATNGLQFDAVDGPRELVCSDPRQMAETVTELLIDQERRRELGRTSRALARRRHSWADAGRRLSRFLVDCGLGGPGREFSPGESQGRSSIGSATP